MGFGRADAFLHCLDWSRATNPETEMPKPITLEMLHEMTPDQRKTLHSNASGLDSDAARDVLELLSQDGLMERPKAATKKAAPAKKATRAKPQAAVKAKAAKPKAAKPVKAVYGRQA